ncbi:MAG: M64 family metallopeptidase [Prevotellaceae bacterium]|nr:M64 family metallopeptidase [Prevotellaceae bacterium]
MKRFFLLAAYMAFAVCCHAVDFDTFFEDNTLRIDYIFSGDHDKQSISLSRLCKKSVWAGRRAHLDEEYLKGDGQLYVYDHATQQLIYVHNFSSLFSEWLMTDEAQHTSKAFATSYNIPFPKRTIDVKIRLLDHHAKPLTELSIMVDPTDILIRRIGENGIPYKYLLKNGSPSDCIDLAIVAEGYTDKEMDKFYRDCDNAVEALFTNEPFTQLKGKFNIVAVAPTSMDSGPSVPHDSIWTVTALGSHFDTFYSDRYLTIPDDHKLHDILSNVPFEHIITLVNTPVYGGGGIFNQWLTFSSDNKKSAKVFVHEFGHAYAGLGDEYDTEEYIEERYPADAEPWEPNLTTMKDFAKKWEDMVGKDGVGVFEGAGYMKKGCYRPVDVCLMRMVRPTDNFCPVCIRAILGITDFYTSK